MWLKPCWKRRRYWRARDGDVRTIVEARGAQGERGSSMFIIVLECVVVTDSLKIEANRFSGHLLPVIFSERLRSSPVTRRATVNPSGATGTWVPNSKKIWEAFAARPNVMRATEVCADRKLEQI